LRDNTIGSNNTAIGRLALENNTTGYHNTAIGLATLRYNTTGISNTAIGYNSLRFNTTGTNNTAIGYRSLYTTTTGTHNTAIGRESLRNNTTGGSNTAIGLRSLYYNITGNYNTAIGNFALRYNTTGAYNTSIGNQALRYNTTGNNNIAFGQSAGRFIADGSTSNAITNASIFIGRNTRALADNQTNQIVIGDSAIGLGSNTVVLGDANIITTALRGNVGIGKTTPNARLDVSGSAIISGSLTVTQGITGSLFGTASFATSASFASTASFVSNAFIQGGNSFEATAVLGTNNDRGLILETSGSARITITTAGNVGIGTNTPNARLDVSGSTIITGSLTVTQGITGSFFGTASYATSASFVNTLNQNVIITGSLSVGTSSLGPSENTLTLGARDTGGEGGQLGFNASGGTYTSASFIDNYQNRFRLLKGTNAGSSAELIDVNLHDGTINISGQTGGTPTEQGVSAGVVSNYWGTEDGKFLSTPATWLKIKLDGTTYYLPAYG
jgi:hypothetical protein